MADKKTSQETLSGPVADADYFRGVQGGSNVRTTFTLVKTWIKSWIAKSDVGLGNVDNTSDANKPLSNAMGVPYTVGDMLYASGAGALSRLAAVAAGQPIISAGVTTAPTYSGTWLEFSVANKRITVNKNTNGLRTPINTNAAIYVHGQDAAAENSMEIHTYDSDSVYAGVRANGDFGAVTPLAANDYVATFVSGGIAVNGGNIEQGNSITFRATENWTVGARGMMTAFFGNLDTTTTFGEWARFRNARLGIGDTNPTYRVTINKNATSGITDPFGNDGFALIGADSGGAAGAVLQGFGANPTFIAFRANGTTAAKTALTSGQIIGTFGYYGYAGSTSLYAAGVELRALANEALGTGAGGTRLEIRATPNGSTTVATALTLYGSAGMFLGSGAADPGAGILQTTGGYVSPSFVVASLPAGVAGKQVYASNARCVNTTTGAQEGAGAGTGSLVTYNTSWKLPGTNVVAAA